MTITINFNIDCQHNGMINRIINVFNPTKNSCIKYLENKNRPKPLIDQLREEIRKSRLTCSESTTINRHTAVNALEKFFIEKLGGGLGVNIETLTPDHIKAFERWHGDHNLTQNYSACNMRNLRALINRIIGKDRADWSRELFAGVRTAKSDPMQQKAVDRGTVQKLMGLELTEGTFEYQARDYFLFCLLAQGMPLIDLAHLKKEQWRDGRIIYNRHKTRSMASPLLLPKAQEILRKNKTEDSIYLFPILTSEEEDTGRQYKRFLQKYNRALHKLAGMIAPDCKLTSYTPRHTWASTAHEQGVNDNVISQALAHKNTATTQAYLKSICYDIIDNANIKVWDYLSQP